MKKILFFAAVLSVAFTSCMNEEFIGDNSPTTSQGTPGAIGFKYDLAKATRADATGSTAAGHLGNQFIVYGEKNETAAAPSAGNYVFPNYQVNYVTSSEMTTTSNTEGWEYVGYTHSANYQTNITTKDGSSAAVSAPSAAQTIKYWDWGASSYTFTAISASTDIENGNVTIQKNTSGTTVYDKGYTLALTAAADLDHLFFSERVFIDRTVSTNASNTNRTLDNTYGGNVTFRFHSMSTKVRVAMYETIPGYSVTINSFKVADAADPAFSAMGTAKDDAFNANFVNSASGTAGSMTVKYVATDGATKNYPTVSFTPTSGATNILTLGDGLKQGVTLGTTITEATYDKADDPLTTDKNESYTSVFPKEDNTQNLKLKVCYTLTAPTTGETIIVTDATAEISAEYLKWKPGFAYTYIFKISDNSNGSTGTPGTNPAGLYPITFDAIEMLAEDGKAEYITTVSEPSITTFGVSAGKYVTGSSEYAVGSDIYATFMEGSTVMTPTLGTSGAQHVNIYKVTTTDATNFPITEASVAEAIAANESNAMNVDIYTRTGDSAPYSYTKVTDATTLDATATYYKADGSSVAPGETGYVETEAVADVDYVIVKIKAVVVNADASTNFTAVPEEVGSVPGEDGTTIYLSEELSAEPSGWATKYSMYYTDNTFATPASSTFSSGTYYRKFAIKLTGVKAGTYAIEYEASAAWTGSFKKVYKVIRVQ